MPVETLAEEPLLRWFKSDHLRPELRTIVYKYEKLAEHIVLTLPRSPERTLALRDLIASKDNAVRGQVDVISARQEE